jgi:hypothetical protein
MNRFDTCGCIGKSLIITANFLWYIVPIVVEASLVIVFQDSQVVFWTLIGSTFVLTLLAGRIGMIVGRELIKDQMAWRDVWNFVPYLPEYFWSLTHLISSLPLWEITNLLTSVIWKKQIPAWLITCCWLAPVVVGSVGAGVGAVIMVSYKEPNSKITNENSALIV